MVWFVCLLVGVGVVVLCRELASGRWTFDLMSAPVRSAPDPGLPDLPSAEDVDDVRFDTAARGYRMGDVDATLDQLRDRLAEQETELAELRGDPVVAPEAADPEPADPEAAPTPPATDTDTAGDAAATDEPAPTRRARR